MPRIPNLVKLIPGSNFTHDIVNYLICIFDSMKYQMENINIEIMLSICERNLITSHLFFSNYLQ